MQPSVSLTIPQFPSVEEGILHFVDNAHLNEFRAYFESLNESKRQEWCQENGFISQAMKYREFFAYSASSAEKGYDKTLEEIREIYNGVILLEDDGNFELESPDLKLSELLNAGGLIRIGEQLRQYKFQKLITIKDGDIEKLVLADRISESYEDELIKVTIWEKTQSRQVSADVSAESPDGNYVVFNNTWGFHDPSSPNGPYEYRLQVQLTLFQDDPFGPFVYEYNLFCKAQKRGFLGLWFAFDTEIYYSGKNKLEENSTSTIVLSAQFVDQFQGSGSETTLANQTPPFSASPPNGLFWDTAYGAWTIYMNDEDNNALPMIFL